jgi:hypothetical protein
MRHHHWSNPHERSIARRVLRGLIPWQTITVGPTRRGDGMPQTEDVAFRKSCEQSLRQDPIVFQEMLQGPKGELCVI